MVVATASAALQCVQNVYQLLTAAQSLKTSTEVRLAISNMLDEVNAAKRAISDAIDAETALKGRIRQLEEQNRQLEERDRQLESYERKRFFPGSIAYVKKGALAGSADAHPVCATCYESRKQIISLQRTGQLGTRRNPMHRCPSCTSTIELGPELAGDDPGPEPSPTIPTLKYSNKGIV
jgi:hypothetical protein